MTPNTPMSPAKYWEKYLKVVASHDHPRWDVVAQDIVDYFADQEIGQREEPVVDSSPRRKFLDFHDNDQGE